MRAVLTRRTLLTTLATAGVTVTALGFAVAPAWGALHSVTVTLVGGKQIALTVEIPAGTPVDQITIPGIPAAAIEAIVDQGPAPRATPTPTAVPDPPRKPRRKPSSRPDSQSDAETVVKDVGARQRARRLAQRRRARERAREREAREPATSAPAPAPAPAAGPAAGPGLRGRVGVPDFFLERFRVPPFLLPIYQAAGVQYGIRWELLAAINEIETDYGRNLNVSTAGAEGWMQFMPATWRAYGVDANADGTKDPYNPVDAIFAAARYLKAAGGERRLRAAVFAYNHADWYVDDVLERARLIGALPTDLVGSLTGLTQGQFPVATRRRATRRIAGRRAIGVHTRRRAPIIAVNDGRITRTGVTPRLGRYVQLQDVYGNRYTYGGLGEVAARYPAPKPVRASSRSPRRELELPEDRKPTAPASAGTQPRKAARAAVVRSAPATKERLFANPGRPEARRAGGDRQLVEEGADIAAVSTVRAFARRFGVPRKDVQLKALRVGSRVTAGTVLGRVGGPDERGIARRLRFEVRPAGRGAPRIDPKPILDGWRLLESTAIHRVAGPTPFLGRDAVTPTTGQILLMSKAALTERVLENPRVELYGCGRRDIQTGQVDRRVLATLELLAASGLEPTVTSLRCGHSYLTASGNVSAHSSGNAVDIAEVNGIPIRGHQGKGSITETTIQRLLTLQGTMKPDQIISLMEFGGQPSTLAMADHDDHIHVGWRPRFGSSGRTQGTESALAPGQWIELIERLGEIENPKVRASRSRSSG